jgi:hypothetical protein
VRINGDEVKANYKGLKNKPGSTRPADITDQVRTSPANYRNNLVVTYALTQKASLPQEVSYPPVKGTPYNPVLTACSEVQLVHLPGEEVHCRGSDSTNQAAQRDNQKVCAA